MVIKERTCASESAARRHSSMRKKQSTTHHTIAKGTYILERRGERRVLVPKAPLDQPPEAQQSGHGAQAHEQVEPRHEPQPDAAVRPVAEIRSLQHLPGENRKERKNHLHRHHTVPGLRSAVSLVRLSGIVRLLEVTIEGIVLIERAERLGLVEFLLERIRVLREESGGLGAPDRVPELIDGVLLPPYVYLPKIQSNHAPGRSGRPRRRGRRGETIVENARTSVHFPRKVVPLYAKYHRWEHRQPRQHVPQHGQTKERPPYGLNRSVTSPSHGIPPRPV